MPELPEVETVRRGLAPYLTGARVERVRLERGDLRFPFPDDFAQRLTGARIETVDRRAKYLLFRLEGGLTWLSHLGMTGSYRFAEGRLNETTRYVEPDASGKHDHVRLTLRHREKGLMHLIYADARRFGFMDLFMGDHSAYLEGLGAEPLGNAFNAEQLAVRFGNKKAPVKAGLLDQRIVAGLGNIYASEALHRAHILPTRSCASLVKKAGGPRAELEELVAGVRQVLIEAIEVGGSTLRDFRNARGESGYFQHRFAVYDRQGKPCPTPGCTGTVHRIVQSGRASFYCPVCQH